MDKNIIDIGAGDCSWIYKKALSQKDNNYYAVEPNITSYHKVLKKMSKSKISNLEIINSNIEHIVKLELPKMDEIFINYPWARLLEGILKCEKEIWDGIFSLIKSETILHISINPLPWEDKTPDRIKSISKPTKEYFDSTILPFVEKNIGSDFKIESQFNIGKPIALTKWIKHVGAKNQTINFQFSFINN